MNDWSINMGIVGFINILKNAELEQEIIMKENYIEFDSSLLEEFHNYYFDYFMREYDIAKRIEKNIESSLNYAKSHEDKLKDISKRIKDDICHQSDKVKKFDATNYEELKYRFEKISKIKSIDKIEELEQLTWECIDILKIKHINEKLTSNLYKYIVGDNYFGQVSFINVAKSNLDVNGLKKVMYNDYILPIIYYSRLKDTLEFGSFEELEVFIRDSIDYINAEVNAKRLSKNSINVIERILKNLQNDFIKKKKSIVDIKNYLESLDSCQMCGCMKGLVDNYTESNFAPLAVSSDNAMNMYWNMDTNMSICYICKLILFCTAAGGVLVRKKYISNDDNEFYSFVNMDTSIESLYKTNVNFRNKRDKDNPFDELIIDIVSENKEKSIWQLENILFIEFKASVKKKKCVMNYFNMPMYLAKFFHNESKVLSSIRDKNLRAGVVDFILKEKDLRYLIDDKFREKISDILNTTKTSYTSTIDIYMVINTRYLLGGYKKGGVKMTDDKKLKSIRAAGREIHDYYDKTNSKNKINGIAYRLLNTAKVRNKKDFMDIVLRLFMSCEKSVPIAFIDVMAEKELDFESIAYAFLAGLVSEKYEPVNEGGK